MVSPCARASIRSQTRLADTLLMVLRRRFSSGEMSAAERRANPDLALRRDLHFERKQHATGGEMRACVAAPVDEADEQVSVCQGGVQRREQSPGRVAVQWR